MSPAPIEPNTTWVGLDAAQGLSPRIVITVESVKPGKHLIDKGPTHTPPDDDVTFTFADGRRSVCGLTAFRRTYVPTEEQ